MPFTSLTIDYCRCKTSYADTVQYYCMHIKGCRVVFCHLFNRAQREMGQGVKEGAGRGKNNQTHYIMNIKWVIWSIDLHKLILDGQGFSFVAPSNRQVLQHPRAIPLLYIILPNPPALSLQPSLLLTPSEPLTGLLNVLGPHFRNKVVRLLCPALSLAWSSSHPTAGPYTRRYWQCLFFI